MEWTKLNPNDDLENLPPANKKVLAYDSISDTVVEAYCWRGDNFRDFNSEGSFISWQPYHDDEVRYDYNFTHWMPWPDRPKEGE